MKNTLEELAKPKQKFTLLVLGGGMMGGDSRELIVTRGWMSHKGEQILTFSNPRGKKIFNLHKYLQSGCIVLRGHEASRPVFEVHARAVDGVRSFIMDGVGGRFIDYDNEGPEALLEYLKKHLVLHTLTDKNTITLREENSAQAERNVVDHNFKSKLLAALGDPALIAEPTPVAPTRKSLLTPKMIEQLRAADGKNVEHPLFKIFAPEGAATWLLCSMEDDGDTLWAVCDLGMDCVEYGTVSLLELETSKTSRFKMHMERDLHFDGKQHPFKKLLESKTLAGC